MADTRITVSIKMDADRYTNENEDITIIHANYCQLLFAFAKAKEMQLDNIELGGQTIYPNEQIEEFVRYLDERLCDEYYWDNILNDAEINQIVANYMPGEISKTKLVQIYVCDDCKKEICDTPSYIHHKGESRKVCYNCTLKFMKS